LLFENHETSIGAARSPIDKYCVGKKPYYFAAALRHLNYEYSCKVLLSIQRSH